LSRSTLIEIFLALAVVGLASAEAALLVLVCGLRRAVRTLTTYERGPDGNWRRAVPEREEKP
jgi:hypothetical protein